MRGKERVVCHNSGSNSDRASPKELKVFAILRSAFSASRLLQPSKCLQGGRSKLRYLGILVEKETALSTNFVLQVLQRFLIILERAKYVKVTIKFRNNAMQS